MDNSEKVFKGKDHFWYVVGVKECSGHRTEENALRCYEEARHNGMLPERQKER
jgi:hypothetical protein